MPAGPLTFLQVGRLLRDKGVREFVEAARIVKRTHPEVRFQLLGDYDENPSAIPRGEVNRWVEEGVIEYLGTVEDVRPFLAAAHVCVLASYAEGMPRSLLEGMAIGRPIIATDVPGCRETVVEGENGWLVAVRDPRELAEAVHECILRPSRLSEMGRVSRAIAQDRYDVRLVNRSILLAIGLTAQVDDLQPTFDGDCASLGSDGATDVFRRRPSVRATG
jgi:glycosyltransferase involved in cell wall biosynthesis